MMSVQEVMMAVSIQHLRKFVAPEIIFGNGARHLSGQYCKKFHVQKHVIVTDKGVIDAGWARQVEESLALENLDYAVFSDVSPNPRSHEVMKGAEIYGRKHCDAIVAVGGGSPMDCAKKIGISSKIVIPDIALIDPETTITMDPYLTACTGMDAMVHAVEAFVSTASSKITDIHALEALRLLSLNLPRVIETSGDMDVRGKTPKDIKKVLFGYIRRLRYSLGISKSLGQVNVKRCDIPDLARNAVNDACLLTNPRKAGQRDIELIYEEAL